MCVDANGYILESVSDLLCFCAAQLHTMYILVNLYHSLNDNFVNFVQYKNDKYAHCMHILDTQELCIDHVC